MATSLRQIARKSRTMIVAYKIYESWNTRRRLKTGDNESLLGATHSKLTLQESVDYINDQFADYLAYAGISEPALQGLRVLEIGFGDNVGVALKFLMAGAAEVVCVDKFYAKREVSQQRNIYIELRKTLSDEQRARFDQAIDLSQGIDLNSEILKCIYGVDVDQIATLFDSGSFDLIISRAVMQDVFDPAPAFEAMDRVLVPGGLMLHKIDLSDQGVFRDNAMHPLTFLTIPGGVYRLMAEDSGNSNRKLSSYYKREMLRLGYSAKLFPTSVIGYRGKSDLFHLCEEVPAESSVFRGAQVLVSDIRPRLAADFKQLPDEDLSVDGLFLVARKSD